MNIEPIRSDLKMAVADSLEAVFCLFPKYIPAQSAVFNNITLFQSRFSKANEDEMKGLVSREQAEVERTRISTAVLDLIDKLQADDLAGSGVFLEQMIGELGIEKALSRLYLVNCDREPLDVSFWDTFGQKKEHPFQFHFVIACPTQQPDSFAERLIYEIIEYELDEQSDAIHLEREMRPLLNTEVERIKFNKLELVGNVEISKKNFNKWFAKRFNLGNTSMTDFLKTGASALPYDYIASVFRIVESDWGKPFMKDFLSWIIETFSDTGENVPSFLFFFVVFMDHAHINPNETILTAIQELTTRYSNACSILKGLTPVEVNLLRDWFIGINAESKGTEEMIQTLVKGMSPEKQALFEKQQTFDMMDIEDWQKVVYVVSNK